MNTAGTGSEGFVFNRNLNQTALPLANQAPPSKSASTAKSAVPPEGSISRPSDIKRLPPGEPILKHLEKLLSDNDIDPKDIEEITVDYLDKDGNYSPQGSQTSANIYMSHKFPIQNKEAFYFEMQWSIKVKGREEPLKLQNAIFTNIAVPKKGDPEVHERAKNRARSIAFVTGNLIKSALDPTDINHENAKTLKENLRSSSKITMSFGTETDYNFRKKTYLNTPILTLGHTSLVGNSRFPWLSTRSADDSIVTVYVGEKDTKQSMTVDLNKLVRINSKAKKILTDAHIQRHTKVTTGPAAILDDMRRLESLQKQDVANLREKMRELDIGEKMLHEFASNRADQYISEFDRLRSKFKPTTENNKIEKLTAKLESGKKFTDEQWQDLTLEVAECDEASERMESLQNDLDRDISILEKFETDFNRRIPRYNIKPFAKAKAENPDQVTAMKEKVEILKDVFFKIDAQRKAEKEQAQNQQQPEEEIEFLED